MPQVLTSEKETCGVVNKAMLSLIKSYRAKSHKVVPVKSLASIISRQEDGEKGKASW